MSFISCFKLKLAGLVFLVIAFGAGSCLAFDRAKEGDRYRQWFQQLEQDIAALRQNAPKDRAIDQTDVERWCARSLVPGSRAAQNFSQWLSDPGSQGIRGGGGIAVVGPFIIILDLLKTSIPAGHGGLFPEKEGSPFPTKTLSVWYMHIEGGSILEPYFGERGPFKPHRLPAEGVLERNVYPFLLFEERAGRLRLGGFGQEWWGAVEYLYQIQLH